MFLKKIFNHLKKVDLKLFIPACVLTSLGLISIYSSSISKGDFGDFKKQLIFFGMGLGIVLLFSFLDLRFLRTNTYLVAIIYLLSLLSLAALFLIGTQVRGVRGWYKLGGFSFDPDPFCVLALSIVLSKYFSASHIEIQRFKPILVSAFYTVPAIGLILLQPDFGSSIALVSLWLGIIIFSGPRPFHFFILTLVFLLLATGFWFFLFQDYQKQRVYTFLNPNIDPKGVAWHIQQSKIAIGNGGWQGKGLGRGSQTQLGFLPEAKTDFIFSALAEEIGFLGVSILIIAFSFLFWRITHFIYQASNNFQKLFAVGFACLLISGTSVNIAMTQGLLPIVGIPLPFVSYGGSYLLAYYLGLGILMGLRR